MNQALNRANGISNKIKELPAYDPRVKLINLILSKQIPVGALNIEIQDKVVLLNNSRLPLMNKDKIFKIFNSFYQSTNYKLDRDTLIEYIYDQSNVLLMSERKKNCLNHNIVKLISRARRLAEQHLSTNDIVNVEWFPYDSSTKTWRFFRVKDEKFENILLSA